MSEFTPTLVQPMPPAARPFIRIELEGSYAGWWAELEADPTVEEFNALDHDEMEKRMNALLALVFRWNFRDRAGAIITVDGPVLPTYAAIKGVPMRAIIDLRRAYIRSSMALPNGSDAAS